MSLFRVASWGEILASPVTRWLLIATIGALLVAALAIGFITLAKRGTPAFRRELWLRLGSWLVLLPLMIVPVLLGKAWLIAAVTLLGLFCLREYDRATGLAAELLGPHHAQHHPVDGAGVDAQHQQGRGERAHERPPPALVEDMLVEPHRRHAPPPIDTTVRVHPRAAAGKRSGRT